MAEPKTPKAGPVKIRRGCRRYYTCFVPGCSNTTISTPDKIFIGLPRSERARKLWSSAARRGGPLIGASGSACCDDHFELEEDAENYMYHKLMGGKIRLKPHVVPHKFACQGGLLPSVVSPHNRTTLKRKRFLADVLENTSDIAVYRNGQDGSLDRDLPLRIKQEADLTRVSPTYFHATDNALETRPLVEVKKEPNITNYMGSSRHTEEEDLLRIIPDDMVKIEIKEETVDTAEPSSSADDGPLFITPDDLEMQIQVKDETVDIAKPPS